MYYLRELIEQPATKIGVNKQYLRIWVANVIGASCENKRKEEVKSNCMEFQKIYENKRNFVELYKKIPFQK